MFLLKFHFKTRTEGKVCDFLIEKFHAVSAPVKRGTYRRCVISVLLDFKPSLFIAIIFFLHGKFFPTCFYLFFSSVFNVGGFLVEKISQNVMLCVFNKNLKFLSCTFLRKIFSRIFIGIVAI